KCSSMRLRLFSPQLRCNAHRSNSARVIKETTSNRSFRCFWYFSARVSPLKRKERTSVSIKTALIIGVPGSLPLGASHGQFAQTLLRSHPPARNLRAVAEYPGEAGRLVERPALLNCDQVHFGRSAEQSTWLRSLSSPSLVALPSL